MIAMRYIVLIFIAFFLNLSTSCSLLSEENYTPKRVMKSLHEDDLEGMYMDEIIEAYGIPYKIEDSLTHDNYNRGEFTSLFKDSVTVSLTYLRPVTGNKPQKNDVVILLMVNQNHGTTFVPVFSVHHAAR